MVVIAIMSVDDKNVKLQNQRTTNVLPSFWLLETEMSVPA